MKRTFVSFGLQQFPPWHIAYLDLATLTLLAALVSTISVTRRWKDIAVTHHALPVYFVRLVCRVLRCLGLAFGVLVGWRGMSA